MDLETAEIIASRVSKRLKAWDLDIQVRTPFVIMMEQVILEIRREKRKNRDANKE